MLSGDVGYNTPSTIRIDPRRLGGPPVLYSPVPSPPTMRGIGAPPPRPPATGLGRRAARGARAFGEAARHPGQRELLHVRLGDLLERAVAASGQVSRIGGPRLCRRAQQLRGIESACPERRRGAALRHDERRCQEQRRHEQSVELHDPHFSVARYAVTLCMSRSVSSNTRRRCGSSGSLMSTFGTAPSTTERSARAVILDQSDDEVVDAQRVAQRPAHFRAPSPSPSPDCPPRPRHAAATAASTRCRPRPTSSAAPGRRALAWRCLEGRSSPNGIGCTPARSTR